MQPDKSQTVDSVATAIYLASPLAEASARWPRITLVTLVYITGFATPSMLSSEDTDSIPMPSVRRTWSAIIKDATI